MTALTRFAGLVIALWALIARVPVTSQAQATASLAIVVRDAETREPIRGAEVRIVMSNPTVVSTNAEGRVRLTGMALQIISVEVRKRDYIAPPPREVDLSGSDVIEVEVLLARNLPLIGRVRSRPSITVSNVTLDASSPERQISVSLLDALGKLSGVATNPSTFGQGFENGVSLNGADPSSTTYAVAGVSQGNQSNTNLAQDLFSGATLSFSPGLGSLIGMVDYQTIKPTKLLAERGSLSVSSFDGFHVNVSASGSVGRLGLAAQHSERGVDAFLDGARYEDQSGFLYQHHGAVRRVADIVALRYSLGARAIVEANVLSAREAAQNICTRKFAVLPCGVGPNDFSAARYTAMTASATGFIGAIQASALYGANTSANDIDESKRFFQRRPEPLTLKSGFSNRTMAATIFISEHAHSIKLEARTFQTTGFYSERVSGRPYAGDISYGTTSLSAADKVSLGRRFAVQLREELNQGNLTGRGAVTSLAASWLPNDSSTLEVLGATGIGQPTVPTLRSLGDPSTALFNCENGTVLVTGPSDPLATQRQSSLSVAYKRQSGENRQIRILAGQQDTFNLQRDLLMPLSGVTVSAPGGVLGYVGALKSYWSQDAMCGAAPFDASRIYVQQFVGGLHQISRFVNASGRFRLGSRMLVVPALTYNNVSFRDLGSRFASPHSLYSDGRQLPLVPRFTAGLTLDYMDLRRREWLLNGQYIGAGNRNNLPPYLLINAGVTTPLQRGRLSFVVSNLFDTHAHPFTESLGFNPIVLRGGSSVSFPSTPLAPLQWSVTYEPRFHGDRK